MSIECFVKTSTRSHWFYYHWVKNAEIKEGQLIASYLVFRISSINVEHRDVKVSHGVAEVSAVLCRPSLSLSVGVRHLNTDSFNFTFKLRCKTSVKKLLRPVCKYCVYTNVCKRFSRFRKYLSASAASAMVKVWRSGTMKTLYRSSTMPEFILNRWSKIYLYI